MTEHNRHPRKTLLGGVLALIITLTCGPIGGLSPAYAATTNQHALSAASSNEEVTLLFLKMAKLRDVEMEELVRKSEKYRRTPLAEQPVLLQAEVNRLSREFAIINPLTSNIVIRVPVKAYFNNDLNGKGASLTIKYPSKGLTYFPYYYGGLPIAVIVNGIENFQTILLSEEERQAVAASFTLDSTATLVLELKPLSADIRNPMTLDNQRQFPFLCDIGYIGLINNQTDEIWSWQADWNKNRNKASTLMNLAPSKIDRLAPE